MYQAVSANSCICAERTLFGLQTGSYTNFFADALIAEAELDARVVGIHAAMGGGTGMNRFEKRFHDRTFDVGIAEQACTHHFGADPDLELTVYSTVACCHWRLA